MCGWSSGSLKSHHSRDTVCILVYYSRSSRTDSPPVQQYKFSISSSGSDNPLSAGFRENKSQRYEWSECDIVWPNQPTQLTKYSHLSRGSCWPFKRSKDAWRRWKTRSAMYTSAPKSFSKARSDFALWRSDVSSSESLLSESLLSASLSSPAALAADVWLLWHAQ